MSRQPTLVERYLAEVVGTFLLTFVGGGAAATAAILAHNTKTPVTLPVVLAVALAHGLILFVIVATMGKISGAHANPAVTIGLASAGKFPWTDVVGYVVAQFVGAIVGAFAILIVLGVDGAKIGSLGAPSLASGVGLAQGLGAEALGAFILVFAIAGTATDSRTPAGWAALVIGMALASAIIFIGPVTGAAVNPARAFGPMLAGLFYGVKVNWLDFLVCYLVGPIIGGALAANLYVYNAKPPRTK
ncbi:MAG TPA: MIP/aquaporin family protein [Ktedonobacterales bacterium]|nr:MIP/aquaporin family protein [Ktedonobacterales bacterium]